MQSLKKGTFRPEKDLDLAWVMHYVRYEKTTDLKGIDVFKFLVGRAPEKKQAQRGQSGRAVMLEKSGERALCCPH